MKISGKQNKIAAVCIGLLVVGLAAAAVWFLWLKDWMGALGASPVYVNRVSAIVGLDAGTENRYSGVAEPQKTYSVEKDDARTVTQIYVTEGQYVYPGDVLFHYDTEEMDLSISQAELDLDGLENQLNTLRSQLADLEKEKKDASDDDQYAYTVEIQSVELQIRSAENDQARKQAELDKLWENRNNADVYSEVEGTVKQVNKNGESDRYGNPLPFISILSSGEIRIKGTVSELNLSSVTEGMPVNVISRIDPTVTWQGLVDTVELEPAADDGMNGVVYYGVDSGEGSSKYNFYVTLDSTDGLILGQHVYIEPMNEGQRHTGLWLPGVYMVREGTEYVVWAKSDSDKLEKRHVTVGEYDAAEDLYQITGGLTRMDSIAYPGEDLKVGAPTTDDAALASQQEEAPGYSVEPGEPGLDDGFSLAEPDPDLGDVPPEDDWTEGSDGDWTDDAAGADFFLPEAGGGVVG